MLVNIQPYIDIKMSKMTSLDSVLRNKELKPRFFCKSCGSSLI